MLFRKPARTRSTTIVVDGITVQVVRKAIKNVHLGVYPPEGRVRVSAPAALSDDAIRQVVASKLDWIRKQQARLAGREQQAAPQYISGERHEYGGRRYVLNVVYRDGPPGVRLRDGTTVDLCVRPGSDAAQRERVLLGWYRAQLRELIPPLIARWEPVLGVRVAEWGVKTMKTRWGSCNTQARRIWLNLDLVRKPPSYLEYVVVHEMVHLLERGHGPRFRALMDRFLPGWRETRKALNLAPPGRAAYRE